MFIRKMTALAFLVISALPATSYAADGTINFTGTITDAACKVTPVRHVKHCSSGRYVAGKGLF